MCIHRASAKTCAESSCGSLFLGSISLCPWVFASSGVLKVGSSEKQHVEPSRMQSSGCTPDQRSHLGAVRASRAFGD